VGGLIGKVLDEAEAELVFEVGFPELFVVVDVVFELRIDEFLRGRGSTPAVLVAKPCSSSVFILQEAAMDLARSMPCLSSCSISWRSFSSPSFPPSSSFPNNIK
jgi:hypothetical protein